uniref:Protein TOPAZ1 n=1 Tax=Neogobius melanostomus TaxID=47308 RepID=A0A8C6SIZ2_9GOBI
MSSKVNMAWTREQGPLTRGRHRQSRPYTRNMRRLAIHRKLKFMCGCCADSENPVNRVRTSTTGDSKSNLSFVGKCYKKRKNIDGPKGHLANKINRVYNRKSCKARVATGRSGPDSVKRDVSASKQAQGQASAAVRAGNSKLTSFGECHHLLPFAFANSRSVKRVSAFGCHACDCAYSECTPKGKNTVGDGKVILWDDSFPKVSLCDISPLCVECQHKCTFVLPDNVTSKHCFKEEMRAGFRFEPGCLSQKKQSFHEIVQVRNNGQPSQLTYVNDQNKDVTNNADSGSLVNHVPQNHKSCEITCSAEQRPNNLCTMQNKCTDSSQNMLGNESLVNIENGISPEDSKTQNGDHMDSPLNTNGFSDSLGSVHCVDSPKRTLEQQLRPNVLALNKTDELDSFTCQRVRVYSGKNSSSCARTYLTWPLLSRKPSSTEHSESAGHPSSFQISQHFEPADPDHPPKLKLSISNQGVGANINENASSCVDASSDLLNKNKNCPLYSSQQRLTMPDILDTFCKRLATSSSQRPAPLQIKGSSSLMIDSSMSTPSPSTLGLNETSPNIFATTLPDTSEVINSVSSSPPFLTTPASNVCCVNQSQTASLDLNDSYDSSSLLPQDMEVSCDETATDQSPPILEPYFKTSQFKLTAYRNDSLMSIEKCSDGDFLLPPLLSPLNSPLKHIVADASVEYECHNTDMPKPKMQSENYTPEITNVIENSHAQNCSRSQMEAFPSHNDVHRFVVPAEEESQQQPLVTDSTARSPPSIASTQSSFSPSSNNKSNDESSDQDSNCSEMSENQEPEKDLENPEALDEVEAYEQDILLVDVFQDDSDLFEKLPLKGLLKLGPVRTSDNPEPGCKKMVKIMPPTSESSKIAQRSSITPVNLDFLRDSPEDSPRRSWRPQYNSTSSALQCGSIKQHKLMGSSEGNCINTEQERTVHFPTENMSHISPSLASRLGFITRNTSTPNEADIRWQKPAYCRNYFSESLNCGFKACRFHHVPMDGDEKFCTETLARFVKNPACLHKAGAVFTGFYQSNKPGVYFSKPVLIALQWALLKAGMLSDLFSVLRTALAHTIVPELEFLLGVFNLIREKCLLSFAPELMHLTLKMAAAGLPLSLDFLDSVKNTELHQTVSATALSGNTRSTPTEYLNLAHAVVEMELCTKQEDWKRLGNVFQSICQSTQQVNQVERISGRIAVALLSESKDRLVLPFAVFAETATHNVDGDSPAMSCLGRIGVSLMLRYHKTHQWAKGLKVVEVLSAAKVSYATMKGLFGNEDGTSRCHLINVATELFLLNNSVEGALNTLRENEWFLTSSVWPCEAADIENRTHVLLRLAEMTSHRDTLEILSNLPGLKEPNGHVDIARYTTFFSAHLQVCLDRQIVALASDLVDFMLSKGLQVDHAMLQMLLHKLGKQNLWLRARAIFKNSLNKGYYPGVSAPHAVMTLMVPSQLGEIELALTFEMFITVNATAILALPENTTSTMSITLKRTQSGESDYLSAGSRLLSAACIPQPKLSVRYTSVNSSQDQVFALDISSARRWLRNNHLWANEVWTIST